MTYERPNVKLIFETRNDITDLIISTYLECYREANKPANAVQKKNNFRQNAPSAQPETKSIGSKISKALGGGDKNKEEALTKLQEFGVTLFMPDGKTVNYDWVKLMSNFFVIKCEINRII